MLKWQRMFWIFLYLLKTTHSNNIHGSPNEIYNDNLHTLSDLNMMDTSNTNDLTSTDEFREILELGSTKSGDEYQDNSQESNFGLSINSNAVLSSDTTHSDIPNTFSHSDSEILSDTIHSGEPNTFSHFDSEISSDTIHSGVPNTFSHSDSEISSDTVHSGEPNTFSHYDSEISSDTIHSGEPNTFSYSDTEILSDPTNHDMLNSFSYSDSEMSSDTIHSGVPNTFSHSDSEISTETTQYDQSNTLSHSDPKTSSELLNSFSHSDSVISSDNAYSDMSLSQNHLYSDDDYNLTDFAGVMSYDPYEALRNSSLPLNFSDADYDLHLSNNGFNYEVDAVGETINEKQLKTTDDPNLIYRPTHYYDEDDYTDPPYDPDYDSGIQPWTDPYDVSQWSDWSKSSGVPTSGIGPTQKTCKDGTDCHSINIKNTAEKRSDINDCEFFRPFIGTSVGLGLALIYVIFSICRKHRNNKRRRQEAEKNNSVISNISKESCDFRNSLDREHVYVTIEKPVKTQNKAIH